MVHWLESRLQPAELPLHCKPAKAGTPTRISPKTFSFRQSLPVSASILTAVKRSGCNGGARSADNQTNAVLLR